MPEPTASLTEIQSNEPQIDYDGLIEQMRNVDVSMEFVSIRYARYEDMRRESKQAIARHGEDAIPFVVKAADDGRIRLYEAYEIFKEMDGESGRKGLEELALNPKNFTDIFSPIQAISSALAKKDNPLSIPILEKAFKMELSRARADIDLDDHLISTRYRLASASELISYIHSFSDIKGLQTAERLYEEFREVENQYRGKKREVFARLTKEVNGIPVLISEDELEKPAPLGLSNEEIESKMQELDHVLVYLRMNPRGLRRGQAHFEQFNLNEIMLPKIVNKLSAGELPLTKGVSELLDTLSHEGNVYYLQKLALDFSVSGNEGLKHVVDLLANFEDENTVLVMGEVVRRRLNAVVAENNIDQRIIGISAIYKGIDYLRKKSAKSPEAERLAELLKGAVSEITETYDANFGLPVKSERPTEAEKRNWSHDKVYIRGSALFATMLGRGHDKVKDVDIFLSTPEHVKDDFRVREYESLEDIEILLDPAAYERIKAWIEQNGFSGKKINLVRINESAMSELETFSFEPQLLFWGADLEREIFKKEAADYWPERKKAYAEGKGFLQDNEGHGLLNPDFIMSPNQTLARALRVMDIAERFELKFDSSILDEAERSIKSGKIIISQYPTSKIPGNPEAITNPVIDPPYLKVFKDKNLRKMLLKNYPRLGQLTEEIDRAGGIEKYMESKYGRVYLRTRGYVRGYDINLTDSPADQFTQERFIDYWYREAPQMQYHMIDVTKTGDEPGISFPESSRHLVDDGKVDESAAKRKNIDAFLDTLSGRYKLDVGNVDNAFLRRKIEAYLSVMRLDWPEGVPMSGKVTRTLISLGVNPRNPVLSEFDKGNSHQVELVLSSKPDDILQASTGKPWNSCMTLGHDLDRFYALYEDIAAGSVIAYIVKDGEFVARSIVRAGISLNSLKRASAIERVYGDARYEGVMKESLKKILEDSGVLTGKSMMTYPFGQDLYTDSGELLNYGYSKPTNNMRNIYYYV